MLEPLDVLEIQQGIKLTKLPVLVTVNILMRRHRQ